MVNSSLFNSLAVLQSSTTWSFLHRPVKEAKSTGRIIELLVEINVAIWATQSPLATVNAALYEAMAAPFLSSIILLLAPERRVKPAPFVKASEAPMLAP